MRMKKKKITTSRTKATPLRTCVACRQVKAKQELERLVRSANGSVEIDTGGRKPGRGAYMCREQGCWETGLKGNRLERTLKTSLSHNNREQLRIQAKELLKGAS